MYITGIIFPAWLLDSICILIQCCQSLSEKQACNKITSVFTIKNNLTLGEHNVVFV